MELPAPLPDAVDAIVRAWKVRIANGRYGPDSVVSTKPSPLTDEVQRKAAARCLYLAAGAALTKLSAAAASGNPCRDLPIFFPGGLDAHDPAAHDLSAIGQYPAWAILRYMNSVEKTASGVPERWYRRVANRDVFNKGCRMVEADCDEYPFYATVQGGPKAPAAGRWVDASLRSTNAVQNQYEGTILRAMTQRCTMSSAVATGENMPPLGGDAHLVVPLPELPVPTFYLCG